MKTAHGASSRLARSVRNRRVRLFVRVENGDFFERASDFAGLEWSSFRKFTVGGKKRLGGCATPARASSEQGDGEKGFRALRRPPEYNPALTFKGGATLPKMKAGFLAFASVGCVDRRHRDSCRRGGAVPADAPRTSSLNTAPSGDVGRRMKQNPIDQQSADCTIDVSLSDPRFQKRRELHLSHYGRQPQGTLRRP